MSATSEPSPSSSLLRTAFARQAENLATILVTFWAGALWTVGFVVAPTLFELLPERSLAGSVAGQLFHSVHWIAVFAGAYVLLFALLRHRRGALRHMAVWLVLAMLAIVAIGALLIQPHVAELRSMLGTDEAARESFAMWHGVSSALYALSCVLAVMLVVKLKKLF